MRRHRRRSLIATFAFVGMLGVGPVRAVAAGEVPCAPSDRVTSNARVRDAASRGLAKQPDAHVLAKAGTVVGVEQVGAATSSVTIPVAVHVLRKGSTLQQGNVPLSQIEAQIAVLNDSFSGLTTSGGPDTGFRFVLSSIDRTTNQKWFTALDGSRTERRMKRALHEGGAETLNLYTGRPRHPDESIAGTATFPWFYEPNPDQDGIFVLFTTLPGGSSGAFGEGDTAVHETGHWFGLLHTYEGDCEGPNDRVADTPAEQEPTDFTGCPVGRDTCPAAGSDPVTNFMSNSRDTCMDRFTDGQATRMASMWALFRSP